MAEDISIQGLQEAQRDNLRMIRALRPNSALGDAVKVVVADLERYAVSVTHVDTGSLRAAHRIDLTFSYDDAEGSIYVDPSARNPRTSARPAEYGPIEEARGGTHAFYERTYDERGDRAVLLGVTVLERGLDG